VPTNHALTQDREGKQRAFMRRITFAQGESEIQPAFGLQGEPDRQWVGQNVEACNAKSSDRQSEGKLADEARKSEGTEIFNAIR
jgi:hypothetical protein